MALSAEPLNTVENASDQVWVYSRAGKILLSSIVSVESADLVVRKSCHRICVNLKFQPASVIFDLSGRKGEVVHKRENISAEF